MRKNEIVCARHDRLILLPLRLLYRNTTMRCYTSVIILLYATLFQAISFGHYLTNCALLRSAIHFRFMFKRTLLHFHLFRNHLHVPLDVHLDLVPM